MAYDPATGQVVLFGGHNFGGYYDDTWTWDGTNWTELFPATSPSARGRMQLVYDSNLGKLLLFGGLAGVSPLDDTWTWDGSNWTQESPARSPSGRWGYAMAGSGNRIVVFGGSDSTGERHDTWAWNGATWTNVSSMPSPSKRGFSNMAPDPIHGNLVMFGGTVANIGRNVNETWTFGPSG